jgi:hypothetical protein
MSATEARQAVKTLSAYLHQHDEELTLDARLALLVLSSTLNQIDPPLTVSDHPQAALVFRKTFFGDD